MPTYKKLLKEGDNVSELTNNSGYLTSHQSLSGYATESWVTGRGYLTSHQSLSAYAPLSDPTFVTRINTPQVRFTDSSKTSFNHLNVAQWSTAYGWGDHSSAGYLTSHQSLSGYATQSWVNSQGFLTSQTDSQTLSISGNSLTISNGNSVTLPIFDGNYNSLSNKPTIPSATGNKLNVHTQNITPTSLRASGGDSTPAGTQFNNVLVAPSGSSTRNVYFDGGSGVSSVSTWYGVGNKPYSAIDVSQTYLSIWSNNTAGSWNRMLDVFGDHSLVRANVNFQSTGVITASGGDSTSWNTAYGWGNHASAGYLTSHQNISGKANLSGASFTGQVNVKSSAPYLYVGDGTSNNDGSWDANIMLDSHTHSRLRIENRGNNRNLLLYSHSGSSEPHISATDSATKLYVGVSGSESYWENNGKIYTYADGNSGFWKQAYDWGNHASAGYLTSHQSLSGYATQSWVNSQGFLKSQTDSQTLSISGKSLTISSGNSVTLPFFDGAYSSLSGRPTIPTNNNQLTNGAGYITSYVNTTYSASTGLSLSGTAFSVDSTIWRDGNKPNISEIPNNSGYITSSGNALYGFANNDYDSYWASDSTNSKANNNAMSIKLWLAYNDRSKGAPDDYGTILDIYGQTGHQRNQLFMGNTQRIWSRSTFYGNNGWYSWNKIAWVSDIPTNNNQLTNGAGYVTSSVVSGYATQSWVNSQGFGTSSFSGSYTDLTNKPTIPSATGNAYNVNAQTITPSRVRIASGNDRTKVSFWNGTTYGIGMTSSCGLGAVNDYAMTFQMNADRARGYQWLANDDGLSSGCMSLTQDGQLYVAKQIQVGRGRSHTSALGSSYAFEVYGNMSIVSGNLYIGGSGYSNTDFDKGITAHGWGNHSSAGYLTSHQSLSGYATQSWVNSQGFLKSQTDSQTLSISGKSLTISSGNSVTLPFFDGAYNSLSGKPTIPTNNNQLTNGAGYITSSALSNYTTSGSNISQFANNSGYLTSHQSLDSKANLSGATFTGNIRTSTINNYANLMGHSGGLEVQSSASGYAGIFLSETNGNYMLQLYATGGSYGFLNAEWSAWDFRKYPNGRLCLNNDTTYYIQTNGNTYLKHLRVATGLEVDSSITFRGSYGLYTAGQSDSISINPDAYLYLGTSGTDRTYIGASTRPVSINGVCTFGQSTSGISYNDLSNKPTIPSAVTNNNQLTNGAGYITAHGIGSTTNLACNGLTTSGALVVNGTTTLKANTTINATLQVNGDIGYTGRLKNNSDIRLKENIKDIPDAVDSISKLKGVTFDWKANKSSDYGVIAQEVEKVFPDLVFTDAEQKGIKSVDYIGMIPILIESIKELKGEIETLKNNCKCKGD